MLEEERKYEVEAGFRLPDLSECAPEGGRLSPRDGPTPADRTEKTLPG